MKVPKQIADKAKVYQEACETARKAFEDVVAWLNENTDGASGVYIDDLFVTGKPTGHLQSGDEYCDQHSVGYCGDSFAGKYYHPIEGSNLYLGYHYDC